MDAIFIDYSYEEIGKTDKKSPLDLKQEKKGNHQLKKRTSSGSWKLVFKSYKFSSKNSEWQNCDRLTSRAVHYAIKTTEAYPGFLSMEHA